MTLAHAAPGLAVVPLLALAAWLLLREGHRDRHNPGHGQQRPHSTGVGTARQDRDAIKEHDMPTPDMTQACTCGHPHPADPLGHELTCAVWDHQFGRATEEPTR